MDDSKPTTPVIRPVDEPLKKAGVLMPRTDRGGHTERLFTRTTRRSRVSAVCVTACVEETIIEEAWKDY